VVFLAARHRLGPADACLARMRLLHVHRRGKRFFERNIYGLTAFRSGDIKNLKSGSQKFLKKSIDTLSPFSVKTGGSP
jgi:hypothetical protein